MTEWARLRERVITTEDTERLGVLSHEMRNLLNTALMSFQSIKAGVLAPGQLHAVTIVIGLVIEKSNDEALAASQGIEAEVVVEPGWRPLGFDIADGAISGLSNCAYKANEADALRNACAGRLNEHGRAVTRAQREFGEGASELHTQRVRGRMYPCVVSYRERPAQNTRATEWPVARRS